MNVEKLSLKDEKQFLRTQFREKRKAYLAEQGPTALKAVQDNVKKWLRDNVSGTDQVCAYRCLPDEPDPCVRPFTELFFPRMEGKSLGFYRPLNADAFTANKLGILEPSPDAAEPFNIKKPAFVLTPAIAVDSLGRRIGNGRGYYDYFFQSAPKPVRVGVVFHVQVSQSPLPAEGWDQLLDWIITDKMILRVSQRSS